MSSSLPSNDSPIAPGLSWPISSDPSTHQNGSTPPYPPTRPPPPPLPPPRLPPTFLPSGSKSLPGISLRAFILGTLFGVSLLSTVQLAYAPHPLWRGPFFIATLSLFHYLEFDTTARYNPPDAQVSSFLLSANGSAYNVAHTAALVELLVRHCLLSSNSGFQLDLQLPSWLPFTIPTIPATLPTLPPHIPLLLGLTLTALGQLARTSAMARAGQSFNHVVQSIKSPSHVLVTSGIYALSRHPSYFGFFWWGLGTQLVLGNAVCLVVYVGVLWSFFANRIEKEEKFLVQFFGDEYVRYRERTGTLIPFIR